MNKVSAKTGIDSRSSSTPCSSDADCTARQDGSVCGMRKNATSGYCIPTWYGLCHAWAPAAILEEEPKCDVVKNNQTFHVMDIKALLTATYDGSAISTVFTGARFNGPDDPPETDAYGRYTSAARRDLGPGFFHVAISNILGKHNQSFILDVASGAQVWNQPIRSYQVQTMELVDANQASQQYFGVSPYPFNSEMVYLAYVKTTVSWIVEAYLDGPLVTTGKVDAYTVSDDYQYLLELDANYNIIGGEWIEDSKTDHPDFLWFPTAKPDRSSVTSTGLSFANVEELLELSVSCGASGNASASTSGSASTSASASSASDSGSTSSSSGSTSTSGSASSSTSASDSASTSASASDSGSTSSSGSTSTNRSASASASASTSTSTSTSSSTSTSGSTGIVVVEPLSDSTSAASSASTGTSEAASSGGSTASSKSSSNSIGNEVSTANSGIGTNEDSSAAVGGPSSSGEARGGGSSTATPIGEGGESEGSIYPPSSESTSTTEPTNTYSSASTEVETSAPTTITPSTTPSDESTPATETPGNIGNYTPPPTANGQDLADVIDTINTTVSPSPSIPTEASSSSKQETTTAITITPAPVHFSC
ncbi:Elicitin [Phytophthora megakarya]|uniref:Elicitin n=1 Tax=Phytophthora megakarya TaxID=4795 RepID=A0A225VE89_9STRA|nr:Elicitin [Phytophthora megakarya]